MFRKPFYYLWVNEASSVNRFLSVGNQLTAEPRAAVRFWDRNEAEKARATYYVANPNSPELVIMLSD